MPDRHPIDILSTVEGIYRDDGPTAVPPRHVWDCVDFLPGIGGAPLRRRGGWVSLDQFDSRPEGIVYASFLQGEALLVVTGDQRLYRVPITPGTSTLLKTAGTINRVRQYPLMYRDKLYLPDFSGLRLADAIDFNGTSFSYSQLPASGKAGRYMTVFRDRIVVAGWAGGEMNVSFAQVGDPMDAWDPLSTLTVPLPVKGLASQRAQMLVFHDGSVTRIKGTAPPSSSTSSRAATVGDMEVELLFDKAGCYDPRTIANWNDQILWADSRGIYITDGIVLRNMAYDAGIATEWRRLFNQQVTALTATAFGDFYIIALYGITESATFLLDIARRKFVRLGNVDGSGFAVNMKGAEPWTAGAKNAQRLYGGHISGRVSDLTSMFQPDLASPLDGDGSPVLPLLRTGWSRHGKGYGFRRILGAFLSYSTGGGSGNPITLSVQEQPHGDWSNGLLSLRSVPQSAGINRPFARWGKRVQGAAFQVKQTAQTTDTRIYGLSIDSADEQESRT